MAGLRSVAEAEAVRDCGEHLWPSRIWTNENYSFILLAKGRRPPF
ncbi:unnamed protein product [Amoebophrya sp. A120]|nr:unnamed protein product [Amoebophrya sp. A120]|eukprot:GSA120T00008406001.1